MHPELEQPKYFHGFHTVYLTQIYFWLTEHLPAPYTARVQSNLSLTTVDNEPRRYEPDVHVVHPKGMPLQGRASVGSWTKPSFAVDLDDLKPTPFLEIRHENQEIITTIEVLSPSNKSGKTGFSSFEDKQNMLARNGVNLIEIDLLQKGRRRWRDPRADSATYLISVLWGGESAVQMWSSSVGDSLPTIPVPLRFPDGEIGLNLEAIIQDYYQRSGILRELNS